MHGVTAGYDNITCHTWSIGSDWRALLPGGQELTTIGSCCGYMRGQGKIIVVYLANQNNLITDVHFYESGTAQYPVYDGSAPAVYTSQWIRHHYVFTGTMVWIRLQPCMQYIVVLGLLQHCSNWKKVVVLKQLIRQRSPTKYRCELICIWNIAILFESSASVSRIAYSTLWLYWP